MAFSADIPNKYQRKITDSRGNYASVDVYDVLKAFDVICSARQHAIKKLLMAGDRGCKDTKTDLIEAIAAIQRAIELLGDNHGD